MSQNSPQRLANIKEAFRLMPPLNPLRWKRHQLGLLLRATKRDRRRFVELGTIDGKVKQSIYPAVRRAINRLHASQSPKAFEQVILTIIGLVLVAATGPAALAIYKWFARGIGGLEVNGWFVAIGFIIAYASIFLMPQSEDTKAVAPVWLSIYPITFLLSLATSLPWTVRIARGWWFSPLYSLMLGAGGMGGFALIVGICITPTLLALARRLRRHLDARLFTKIVALMEDTERNPRRWEELPFRAHLAKELEAIASLIENGLPAAYSSKDELFRRWILTRSRGIATYIRELKSWLAAPRQDTRGYFLEALGRIVICLGHGDWDGMPSADPPSGALRADRIATLLSAVRTLLASILPAGILVSLHRLHRDPPSQISGYLTFGAAAWLTVGCISLLDPLYSTKLEAFKSALQFLPGLKKD